MSDMFQLRCEECGHETPNLGFGWCHLLRKNNDGDGYLHGLGHPCEQLEAKELGEDLGAAERQGRVWISWACHCQACGRDFEQYRRSKGRFNFKYEPGLSELPWGCHLVCWVGLGIVAALCWVGVAFLGMELKRVLPCCLVLGAMPLSVIGSALFLWIKRIAKEGPKKISTEPTSDDLKAVVHVTVCPGCLSKDFVQTPGYQGDIDRPGLKCPKCEKFAMKMVNHTFG